MYKFWLFTHLASMGIWLGALILAAIIFSLLRKQTISQEIRKVYVKLSKVFNAISHSMATLVLVSGVIMILQMDYKAFWLNYMERFGGTIIILSMIFITILGKRVVKQIDSSSESATNIKGFGAYMASLIISIVAILSVIFVVAFRITL